MKLLLIGPTGSIGSTILHQCLANPFITSLVILSRRPLSTEICNSDPRVRVIIVDSYIFYDGDVLEELEEAIGCVWYALPREGRPWLMSLGQVSWTIKTKRLWRCQEDRHRLHCRCCERIRILSCRVTHIRWADTFSLRLSEQSTCRRQAKEKPWFCFRLSTNEGILAVASILFTLVTIPYRGTAR